MNRLYCAGKFNFDYLEKDYKSKAAEDYRAIILEDVDLLLKKHTFVPLSTNLQYIGPFYFEADDMDSNTIVSEEIKMINACTHAIFLLDDADCPGTISELILAGSLGKNIGIFYIRHSSNEETESDLHTPCWFPIIMSSKISNNVRLFECSDYKVGISKIMDYLQEISK